jgi:hypothetical protein
MSSWESFRTERRADQAAAAEQARLDRAALEQARLARQMAAAEIRRADQTTAARHRAQRRTERRVARAAWWASLPDRGMDLLWATMIVLPISLAWQAQAAFAADRLHITGVWANAFPAAIECGAWVCVFEARRRIRAGKSAGGLIRSMWLLAGIAAAINASHGGSVAASLALGVLSLLGVLLHSIRSGLDRADQAGGVHVVRRAVWRRVRYPRLSLAAASIRAARELDAATAWRLAWEDRYGVGPDSTRRERRLARHIRRREARDDRKAARTGELAIVGGRVQYPFAPVVREFVDAERGAAIEAAHQAAAAAREVVDQAEDALLAAAMLFGPDGVRYGANPPGEQHELSPRAQELLPSVREAITAGGLPANPSVRRLRDWVRTERRERLGVPVAMELRDAVAGLRLVDDDQPPTELDGRIDDVPAIEAAS